MHSEYTQTHTPSRKYHFFLPLILQKIGYIFSYIIFRFFVRLEIRGCEHLKELDRTFDGTVAQPKPLIIAANHTSELDPMVVPLIFPFFSKYVLRFFPIYFVSNPKEKYRNFGWRNYVYGGFFFNVLGAYSVHSGQQDYAYALSDHIELLQRRKTVFIFPEGKRTRTGSVSTARGGVAYLAYTTGASVLPVAIKTFFNLSWYDFLFRRRKVVVMIGKIIPADDIVPVVAAGPTVEDFKHGAQMVINRIDQILKNVKIESI